MNSIGRYQLVETLGQGGMGVVYRAFDTLLQRVVAVKVISGAIESGGEQRERFFREARAAGQLSHRNIITIYDLGEQDGQPYLAMEYLEGQDLQRRLTRPERMSLARKIDLVMEVCQGLEYAHARGVIHRDIKPANIFITDNGTAKILDFGLARLVTSELTNSNMMMGTINYMAPEQVRGERADHRSDIFSVGVVLYELLGGRKAFEGESFATTLYRILQEEPESLLHIDPTLPPELVAIVERGLAKPRDERYQNMSELLRDLAVQRQQMAGYETPSGGRPASGGQARPSEPPQLSRSDSDAPTIAHVPTPFPAIPSWAPGTAPPRTPSTAMPPPPVGSAPGQPVPVPAPRRAIWIAAAAGIVALTAFAIWAGRSPKPPAPQSSAAPAQAPALDQAAVANAVRQATEALDAGDFAAAVRHADAALALAPDNGEARRIRERANTTLEGVTRGLRDARAHLAAGRFEEASRAAGAVLSLVPGQAEARQLMQEASTRSRGRGADEARTRMIQAKSAARAASAAGLASAAYEAALGAERSAQRLYDSGQLADATARFYEASGLFRSAELSAQSEAVARAERAEATRAEKERQERERAAAAPPAAPPAATPPPPVQPPAPVPQSLPVTPAPRSTEPAFPPSSPTKPPPPPEPTAESLITDLLGRYKAALETRSLTALRRAWPGLSGSQETGIRDEFKNASRIEVDITSPRIEVAGDVATVTFTRHYMVTIGGERFSSQSATTMRCRRTAGGWVIEQVRFDASR